MTVVLKHCKQVKAEIAKGRTPQAALRNLCGVVMEQGHANGAVASFAVQDDWVPDSEVSVDCLAKPYPACVS
jgi:hypothetical protein